MAEQEAVGIKSKLSGWIKAGIASLVSLASGAVLMYLTPLVNNVVKPAKPVANFSAEITGLNLLINNRTTGGIRGWWDFGDGSALEPYDPKAETVKHVYAKPGKYDIKLAVQNLLNEESNRTASVTLETPTPEIASFELASLSPGETAPALYRLKASIKNATHCLLIADDDQPLEIITDPTTQDRYITYKEMGAYNVRLVAFNGKQIVEKSKQVFVGGNETNAPIAKLNVAYDVVKVERTTRDWRIACDWPANTSDTSIPFRKERTAYGKSVFISAELLNNGDKSGAAKNVRVELAPDGGRFAVAGELTRPSGAQPTAPWIVGVRTMMERRSEVKTQDRGAVMMAVEMNTPMKLPMQPVEEGFEVVRKTVKLELWEGNRKVWEGDKGVSGAKLTLRGQPCTMTAIHTNDGVVLKIDGQGVAPSVLAPPVTKAPPPITKTLPTTKESGPITTFPPPPPTKEPGPITTFPPPAFPPPIVPASVERVGPIRLTGYERNPLIPRPQQ